jgi:hypothetical protein
VNTTTASLALLSQVPAERWQALSGRRVWFGHQSVGGNIVQGIADLVAGGAAPIEAPVQVNATDTVLPRGFSHGANGQNMDPKSKMEAFARFVGEALHGEVDIAFFKFCYVDIDQSTDVAALAAAYRKTIAALSEQHPRVKFVHVTCPLTAVTPRWRAGLKRMLGRPEPGFEVNRAREQFNRLLREAYRGREAVFDLALLESTQPDGSHSTFRHAGETWPALVPAYSHDGRHLNQDGRRWAAANLLATLTEVAADAGAATPAAPGA